MPRQRAIHADEHLRQPPPFIPGEADPIEVVSVVDTSKAELEAFMNEIVTVVVADTSDENAPPFAEVSVNGRRVFIPRGVPTPVKRMYVERLARAKRTAISQNLDPRLGESMNQLHRRTALDYPFSVVEDTPQGRDWLKGVLASD